MRAFRQNVIISHGGRHGPSSRTLRKGTSPTVQDLEQIPDHVLGAVTGLGVDAPAADPATEARVKARDAELAADPSEELKKAVRTDEKAKAKKVTKTKAKAKAKKEEAPPPPPPPAEKPSEPSSVVIPTTKRDLFLLRKTEALALLDQLGTSYPDDISGKAAKELLAGTLNLE